MEIKCGIHNEWRIVVRDAKTGGVKREATGYNIILNQFWARYLSDNNATCLSYIHVGSGTTTPVATNTQLGGKFAHYTSANEVVGTSQFVSTGVVIRQLSCRIETNTYVGQTIAEVGFAYGTTATSLMTHSLLKDMNGNALTIPINADEVIDIYGTFYFKIGHKHNNSEITFNQIVPGAIINAFLCKEAYTSQAIFVPSFGSTSGITHCKSSPLLTDQKIPIIAIGQTLPASLSFSYDVSNRRLTVSIPNVTADQLNIAGGIGTLVIALMQIQMPCTGFAQPVITKEVVGIGDGSNKDFQTAFGYLLNNGTAKVYVNDVEVSATFDYNQQHPLNSMATGQLCVKYLDISNRYFYYNKIDFADRVIAFENPLCDTVGITGFTNSRYCNVYTSDDLETWTLATSRSTTSAGTITIPAEHRYKRYWKITPYGTALTNDFGAYSMNTTALPATNVHLSFAPNVGDTVAVTYQPDVIAKDDQRTLKNISVTFNFAEYTP